MCCFRIYRLKSINGSTWFKHTVWKCFLLRVRDIISPLACSISFHRHLSVYSSFAPVLLLPCSRRIESHSMNTIPSTDRIHIRINSYYWIWILHYMHTEIVHVHNSRRNQSDYSLRHPSRMLFSGRPDDRNDRIIFTYCEVDVDVRAIC